jgi:hypothetical protein
VSLAEPMKIARQKSVLQMAFASMKKQTRMLLMGITVPLAQKLDVGNALARLVEYLKKVILTTKSIHACSNVNRIR